MGSIQMAKAEVKAILMINRSINGSLMMMEYRAGYTCCYSRWIC